MDFRNLLGTLNQLNESVEVVAEKITKDMSAEEIIKDFQQSDDPKFNGKSQEERRKMALGAYYDMHPEKSNESVEEANESPDERLKALGDLYQNAIDTIKRTENIMNMTPPGPNRDYYEAEIGQMEEYAKKIKKDYQALEAGIKGADNIRAQASAESFDSEAFRESFEKMVESKFKKGDKVTVDGKETEITVPDGPGPLVGVKKDGKTDMVKADRVKKKSDTDESVAEGKSKHPKGSKKYRDQMAAKHASMAESINESFEKFFSGDKLTFEEAVKIVRESGGQQKIDPIDTALWNWAQRVGANKFDESRKAELYAGLIYERNGGEFQIHDVLSED